MTNYKIKHPWVAFCVIFVIAALLSKYGVINGSAYLFVIFAGIIIYKFITLNY